jgi:outer membrane usher protein FimD/PapC
VACFSGALTAQPLALARFDEQTLRLRGIDPEVARYLAQAPRFRPGPQPVDLTVNGQTRGRVLARFDGQGELCIDPALAATAGLRADARDLLTCHGFMARYPLAEVELRPASGEVALYLLDAALAPVEPAAPAFQSGGVAGLFNYELQGLHSQFEGRRSQFWSLNSQVGFNAGDWIVRSRQLHYLNDGQQHFQHVDAYAQRSFITQRAVLQAGQINLSNPVLASARITGLQWASEPLLRAGGTGVRIREIAMTPARIEVRQGGVLLYTTVVAEGPFELDAIPDLDPRRDVQLTIVEADGQRREVQVPSSTFGAVLPSQGFALGAGHLRDAANGSAPWVLGGGWSQPLWEETSLAGGAVLAEGYHAWGAGLALQPWLGGRLQSSNEWARDEFARSGGTQMRLALGQQLGQRWQLNAQWARRTPGYRDINERSPDTERRWYAPFKDQYTLGLSWAGPTLGSLGAGYSATRQAAGERGENAYLVWSRQLGKTTLSANAQWQLGSRQGLGNALYLSASLPLGERRRLRASQRSGGGQQRAGVTLQEQVDERLAYTLGAERTARGGKTLTDLSTGVSLLLPATQLDSTASTQGPGNHSYSVGARGAMAIHEAGLTFSPYTVHDTFALLKVGNVAGVRVDTPGGTVWTDRHGRAVIAQMSAYRPSNIEVQTHSLPRNVDVRQGAAQLLLGRGAVARLRFDTALTRRVLLRAVDDAGVALTAGMMVLDEGGGLVSLVQEGGLIFVPDVLQHPQLRVRLNARQVCDLNFQLPEQADLQAYFESAGAVCRLG